MVHIRRVKGFSGSGSNQTWMTLAAQAIGRRLRARGMEILCTGESEDPVRWRSYAISFNGIEFAGMEIRSSSKSSKYIEVRVHHTTPASGSRSSFESLPLFTCGGRMRRSPNIRKFGAIVAKRLVPYGTSACEEQAREIHDS